MEFELPKINVSFEYDKEKDEIVLVINGVEKRVKTEDMIKKLDKEQPRFIMHSDGSIEQIIELCEDCISRRAVLDGIDAYIEKVQSTGAKDDFISFEELVVKALPPVTPKPKTECSCEQIKWERDTAIAQLKELGYGLGEKPKTGWIPLKTRPMTEEETEHYFEYMDMRIDDTYTILDCPLPDDGQEVLVSWGGMVCVDTFFKEYDGCYFEGVDIDDVDAWQPLPKPYKAESEDKI